MPVFRMINRGFRFIRPSFAALAVGVAALIAQPAAAQFGGLGYGRPMSPDFTNRDMRMIAEELNLNEGQRYIVEALLEDYQETFEQGREGLIETIKTMREDMGNNNSAKSAFKTFMGPFDKWRQEKIQLRSEFLDNLNAQLSETQLQNWPSFKRRLRREKDLPQGELSGESIDLRKILSQMQVSDEVMRSISKPVHNYEIALDEALRSRQQAMQSKQEEVSDAMQNMDFETGMRLNKQIMNHRIAIRNVQEASMREIRDALPSEYSEDFQERYYSQAFPKVFRRSRLDRIFEKVYELQLQEQQRQTIKEIETDFYSKLEQVNREIVEVIKSYEPTEDSRRTERLIKRRAGERPGPLENPEREAIAKRTDLEDKTIERIKAVLTKAQKEEIFPSKAGRLTAGQRAKNARKLKDAQKRRQKLRRRGSGNQPGIGSSPGSK